MRLFYTLLACIWFSLVGGWAASVDLMTPVPAAAPAYGQLRLLAQQDLLSTTTPLAQQGSRLLTRYDVALLLIEPMERFVALVDAQEQDTLTLEQQRRKDLAYDAIAPLSSHDLGRLLTASSQLLLNYQDVVDALSPGLSQRASVAIRKLGLSSFRPWLAPPTPAAKPSLRVSVDPSAPIETFGDPLPLTNLAPPRANSALFFRMDTPLPTGERPLPDGPLNAFRTTFDIALGRALVYGSLSALPGQDAEIFRHPQDATGKAMVGVRVDMFRVRDLGISGIFEYHILRSGEPGDTNTDTGAVGGIGLAW